MKKETIERANALIKEIEVAEKHLMALDTLEEGRRVEFSVSGLPKIGGSRISDRYCDEFNDMPPPLKPTLKEIIESMVVQYTAVVKTHIRKLKKQLRDLKDE